jgi:hypothetical protein
MPFGDSMFGPWRTNGQPTQAPIVVGERIPAFTTVLWPVMNAHGWDLTYSRDVILPDAVAVPDRVMSDREFALDWLRGLCRKNGLTLNVAGTALNIQADPAARTDGNVSVEVIDDGRLKVSCEQCAVGWVILEVARKAVVQASIEVDPGQTWSTRVTMNERTVTVREAMERLAQLAEMRLVVSDNPDGTVAAFYFKIPKE